MTLNIVLPFALTILLALFVSWALLLPFLESGKQQPHYAPSRDALEELAVKKENLLQALEDLEIDYRAKKVTEAEFREAREELLRSAARCQKEIAAYQGQDAAAQRL